MATISRRMLLMIVGAAVIPLVGIAVARILLPIKLPDMTRDVAAIAGIHPLSGILSSMSILFWWTSGTIWLFAAFLRRVCLGTPGVGLMVYSGLLSTYLGLDDLFQFHEYLAPTYLKVSEPVVYCLLAFAVVFYLYRYRRPLQRPDGVLLLVALALLSSSVVVDVALKPWLWRLKDWSFLVEDGLKWLGLCFWTAFCIVRCTCDLRPILQVTPSEPLPAYHTSLAWFRDDDAQSGSRGNLSPSPHTTWHADPHQAAPKEHRTILG